ncbi:MAG: aminotransferase class IV [Candidatus Marinarcus sp.]|uniref:aminotransferase class IV n=1 Tax=Candidatus Marinarcus sp. TaxID=3100987 RepID=UPI003AFF963A
MHEEETFFETIKCDDGISHNLEYHSRRIARTISLNINLHEYILPINDDALKCKVIYDMYGILDVIYEPYVRKEIKTFKIIEDNTLEYKFKSTNRDAINALLEHKDGADEIIIVQNELVTDTSIANIAIYDGESWFTTKQPLLQGTTRERFLDNKALIERDITVEMLKNSKKIALLNAMVGMYIIDDYSFLE